MMDETSDFFYNSNAGLFWGYDVVFGRLETLITVIEQL